MNLSLIKKNNAEKNNAQKNNAEKNNAEKKISELKYKKKNYIKKDYIRKKHTKNIKMLFLFMMVLVLMIMNRSSVKGESKENITVAEYIEMLVNTLGLEINPTEKQAYINAAIKAKIVNQNEFKNYTTVLTRENAALLTNRADEIKYGEKYDEELYQQIIKNNRISDLKKVSTNKKDSVIKMYIKGYMIGNTNGKYKQNRKFQPKLAVTKKEANTNINRLKSKSKRRKLSPDGQLIRTTKLPKNYKKYEYILESLPNSFYEKKFYYEFVEFQYEPIEFVDYTSPIRIKKMNLYKSDPERYIGLISSWCKKVETNLNTRLNVDYRTIDSEWINKLRNTYYISDDAEFNKPLTDEIKKYVKKVKSNKVIIKTSHVVVEPSTLYYKIGSYYVRAYIRFKVESANNIPSAESYKQPDLIFTDDRTVYFKNLKKGEWREAYVDIGLATRAMNGRVENYAISWDRIGD